MRRLLVMALSHHGKGMYAAVVENGAAITGIIIAGTQPVYLIGDRLTATDLFWVCDGGEPRDAVALMKSMLGWAWLNPMVVEVVCASNTVILEDPEASGRILQRLGMKPAGNIYRMERQK
jgi:hypothetical protein